MSANQNPSVQEVLGEVLGPWSDNERLKRESHFLRGTIEQDLQDRITHGLYRG